MERWGAGQTYVIHYLYLHFNLIKKSNMISFEVSYYFLHYLQSYNPYNRLQVLFVDSTGEPQSSISRQIGFRKVKLVQESIQGAPGEYCVIMSVLKSHVQTDATAPNIVASVCHRAKSLTGFKLYPTTRNYMQQGVRTDATCNIQQCWELLANRFASVCTELNNISSPIT